MTLCRALGLTLMLLVASCRGQLCDEAAYARASGQLAAGELERLLSDSDTSERECGPQPRLRQLRYDAKMRLRDYRGAVAEASRAIEREPNRADGWAWRGAAHEQLRAFVEAAEDYRAALERDPTRPNLLATLLEVDFRRDAICHAMTVVSKLEFCQPSLAATTPFRDAHAKLSAYWAHRGPDAGCMGGDFQRSHCPSLHP